MTFETLVDKPIEQNVWQSTDFASKKACQLIGSIPWSKKVPSKLIESILAAFSEMSNPRIGVFTEKMNDMIQIYNHTEVICFDQERLYLVGE